MGNTRSTDSHMPSPEKLPSQTLATSPSALVTKTFSRVQSGTVNR